MDQCYLIVAVVVQAFNDLIAMFGYGVFCCKLINVTTFIANIQEINKGMIV